MVLEHGRGTCYENEISQSLKILFAYKFILDEVEWAAQARMHFVLSSIERERLIKPNASGVRERRQFFWELGSAFAIAAALESLKG